MIYLKKVLHNILSKRKKWEECGFILGRKDKYDYMIKTKNVSKKPGEFKISFWDKIKLFKEMYVFEYNQYIPFHVHFYSRKPSVKDLMNMKKGKKLIIIFDGVVYAYEFSGKEKYNRLQYKLY